MKPRELYLKTHEYLRSVIVESKKISGIVDIKGKVSISTGKREVSYQYDSIGEREIPLILIDMIGCLRKKCIKSVKIELTVHLMNKDKVPFSDYIKAEDVTLEFDIDWEALEEAEVFSKTLLGKRKDERKLIYLIGGLS